MRTVHVVLTQADIDEACGRTDGDNCPHYRAISHALGNPDIHVGSYAVEDGDYNFLAELPDAVVDWIRNYDRAYLGNPALIVPMEYDLEVQG